MFQSRPLLTLSLLILLVAPILSQQQNTLPNSHYFRDDSFFLEDSAIIAASSNQPSQKFRIDFFVDSLTDATMSFFKDFTPIYEKMKQDIHFVPHYIFKICGPCQNQNNFTYNLSNCVSGGRYCVKGAEVFQNWDERDIVLQSIREICIYNKSPEKWWEYQSALAQCDKACYDDIYPEIGLSRDEIYKCAADSFEDGDEMKDNKHLQEHKLAAKPFIVQDNHTVFFDINGLKIRKQALPVKSLVHELCGIYQDRVSYCKDLKKEDSANPNKAPFFSGYSLFIAFTALAFLAYVLYHRSLRKNEGSETGIQLDEKVSQYFALEDEDTKVTVRRISMQKLQKQNAENPDSN